jgi:hypothetical protein
MWEFFISTPAFFGIGISRHCTLVRFTAQRADRGIYGGIGPSVHNLDLILTFLDAAHDGSALGVVLKTALSSAINSAHRGIKAARLYLRPV